VAKLDGVTASNIAKVNGLVFSSAPAFLLDTYTGAAAAYSVRRLNSQYTGAAMRVREDSGDTETDIGFDASGNLDTAAIATHCGSASGYVSKWYGQEATGGTGSGNDAEQTTEGSQPQIYDGSTVITENGKPAVHFDTAISHFRLSKIDTINTVFFVYTPGATMNRVIEIPNTASDKIVFHVAMTVSNSRTFVSFPDSTNNVVTCDYETSISGQRLVSSYDNSNSFLDGSAFASNGNGFFPKRTTYATIGIRGDGAQFGSIMHMQEVILYDTDHSSAHTTIETDINNYFSIY